MASFFMSFYAFDGIKERIMIVRLQTKRDCRGLAAIEYSSRLGEKPSKSWASALLANIDDKPSIQWYRFASWPTGKYG